MSKCDNCFHVDLCVSNEEQDEENMCQQEGRDCFMTWERADEINKEYLGNGSV